MSGKRSVIFREQDFKETGENGDFMNQLMELEMEGLVKVKWYQYGIEAEKAWYSLEQMETIYQRLGKIPKFKRINKLKERGGPTACFDTKPVDTQLLPILSQSLDKGRCSQSTGYPKTGTAVYLFQGHRLSYRNQSTKRIFSKKYLGKSKAF